MRFALAACLALIAAPAIAEDADWHTNGRAMLADVIAIPSVSDRTTEVKRMAAYMADRFAKAGFTDVTIKDHDGTQSMIMHWKMICF